MRLPLVALVTLVLLGACGNGAPGDGAMATPPVTTEPATSGCSAGFTALAGDGGCVPVLPPSSCPPGTRAALGHSTCAPVGVTACAPGFARDATGWGCDAVLAPVACASGSGARERLGSATCAAVDDCGAPFPPAGASLVVDAALDDAHVDATHLRTVGEAVTAAADGAVIAVEAGSYAEALTLQGRKVSLVGRCSQKVLLTPPPGSIVNGITLGARDDALLQGLTLRGYSGGVTALGARATLASVVVEDSLYAGIVASGPGASVRLTNVVVRGSKVTGSAAQAFGVMASSGATLLADDSVIASNEFFNVVAIDAGTTLSLGRSIVRDGTKGTSAGPGLGVYVAFGATAAITESAIVDNTQSGINVFTAHGAGVSTATVTRSVVRRTRRDAATQASRGIELTGTSLVLSQSTIGDTAELAFVAAAGSSATIDDATFLGGAPSVPGERGPLGLVVQDSKASVRSLAIVAARAGAEVTGTGTLAMDASLVTSTLTAPLFYEGGHWIGIGVVTEPKTRLTVASSTVQDAHTVGILVTGQGQVTDTLVRGTRAGGDGFAGRGFDVQNGGHATLTRSAFVDNAESGVAAQSAGSTLTLDGSTVQDTVLDRDGHFGIGVLLDDGAQGTLDASTILSSRGIGLAVAGAGAFVQRSAIARNLVGVHTQDGTTLEVGDTRGGALALVVSADTRFVDNVTRVGNGVVPLPVVLSTKSR